MIQVKTLQFKNWRSSESDGVFEVDLETDSQHIALVTKTSFGAGDHNLDFTVPFYTEVLLDRYVELTKPERFSFSEGFTSLPCRNFSQWLNSEWYKHVLENEVRTVLKEKLVMLKHDRLVELDSETLIQDYEAAKNKDNSLILLNHLAIGEAMRMYFKHVYLGMVTCD